MALSAPRNTKSLDRSPVKNYPVAASATCYSGGIAAVDSSGNVKPGVTGSGLLGAGRFLPDQGIGVIDNSSGLAGAKRADVEEGTFWYVNGDTITAADYGKPCYFSDDQTVNKSSSAGARSPAGRIRAVDTDLGVAVEMSLLISRQIAEEDADDLGIAPAATELTIASGAITITQQSHTVDTESDGASDDLDTISGGTAEQVIYLRAASAARTVVLKHNTGNIFNPYGKDISLAESTDQVALFYNGAKWIPLGRSVLASPGGAYTLTYSTADRTLLAPTAVAPTADSIVAQTALQENGGSIGGTSDGNLPALVDPAGDAGASVIAGIRECATKINLLVTAMNAVKTDNASIRTQATAIVADDLDVRQAVAAVITDMKAAGHAT